MVPRDISAGQYGAIHPPSRVRRTALQSHSSVPSSKWERALGEKQSKTLRHPLSRSVSGYGAG